MKTNVFITTLPTFKDTQCMSFCWFLTHGLLDSLKALKLNFSIRNKYDFICFPEHFFFITPRISLFESQRFSKTYSLKLYFPVNITYLLNGVIDTYREVSFLYLGEIPLMTNRGTFIINGYEKVFINQLIRNPGLYFFLKETPNFNVTKCATLIPQRGGWLHFEQNLLQSVLLSFDKSEKFSLNDFFSAFFFIKYSSSVLNYSSINDFSKKLNRYFVPYARRKLIQTSFKFKMFNSYKFKLGNLGTIRLRTFLPAFTNTFSFKDLLLLITYICNYFNSDYKESDIDHLKNKHIKLIGETLQVHTGITTQRLKRKLIFHFKTKSAKPVSASWFFNLPSVSLGLNTFFSSSQLIQFLDQTNSLAELAHTRRLMHYTVGGSSSSRNLKLRDIHTSYFGRICPIETAEGTNAGLTSALALYTRINSFGLLETPFFLVSKGYVLTKAPVVYLTSYEEQFFKIAPADTTLTYSGQFKIKHLILRFKNLFIKLNASDVQLISVSALQFFSVGISLIPFMEHNDANRVLMGANMQRQATPLFFTSKPIIGTGFEISVLSNHILTSYLTGYVLAVNSLNILLISLNYRPIQYTLLKFQRSNQNTCLHQKGVVWPGEIIYSGQIIADGNDTENGELSLGQNVLVAYMSWNGFNFEDSILINERLIFSDLFTSITIFNFIQYIKIVHDMPEFLTSDFVYLGFSRHSDLDLNGIIKIGAFIKPFMLLIGKITPQLKKNISNFFTLGSFKLKSKVFGLINTSVFAPVNCYGRVLDRIFGASENISSFSVHNRLKIILIIAQLKKLNVGDKLSGRHGNKGIISKILSYEDMPYLPNGTVVDIILNPLGVPSRMNVGQLFEGLLGFASNCLERRFKIQPFDEVLQNNASRFLITHYLKKSQQFTKNLWVYNKFTPGKLILRDGKTGNCFDNAILVCKSYILKLMHFVEDKIQSRSISAYSLISQQPVHGKRLSGGQRFGEMEVWALEAFGAAYTLHEMLTLKSDDSIGRNKLLNAILTNTKFKHTGIPESFHVLLYELKALGLNIEFFKTPFIK